MNATQQRDETGKLAKLYPRKALEKARGIRDPWFKAQALSWVARFTDGDPVSIAKQAAKAASECNDEYKKTAVRAWEIAALGERGHRVEARRALDRAMSQSKLVTPSPSRAEALTLLLHAAFRIGKSDARLVADELKAACGNEQHWRCKRAVRDADKLFTEELRPRSFFW